MQRILESQSPILMGILNTTPDSFSDGGRYARFDGALKHAEAMIEDGADVIDIGGESTRPGAKAVSESEELDRVIPLVEAVVQLGKPVSVDTSKTAVMAESLRVGAAMINDVRALQAEGAVEQVAKYDAEVCLMHMKGEPRSMQNNPHYDNVVDEVIEFLERRVKACTDAGIAQKRICLDPGFGFGKTLDNNCNLLNKLSKLQILQCPLLIGVSRKSMIGDILNVEVSERMVGSVSAALIGLMNGAQIVRAHDIRETRQMMDIYSAIYS